MIGKTLGNFEITGQLGKGGMGEVYQAKDRKLGRDVAIKVLPDEFAKDADPVARLQREAKMLASLNHPNIAAIYGLEESGGTNFLVLELVEGANSNPHCADRYDLSLGADCSQERRRRSSWGPRKYRHCKNELRNERSIAWPTWRESMDKEKNSGL